MTVVEAPQLTEQDAAKLAARVEEQIAEEAKLVDTIAELRKREEQEIEEAMRAGTPGRGGGSKAEGTRRKRETAERRLVDIREFELPAARRLAAEAADALRRVRLADAEAQSQGLRPLEEEAAQRIALAYDDLLRGYAALAEAASAREAIYEQLEQSGLLNGVAENERWRLQRVFQTDFAPFPASPAALFEALEPAVLDPHAADDEGFAQRQPFAARFVKLLSAAREDGLYRRCGLRLTEMRSALADYNSSTRDNAGPMARRLSVATRIDQLGRRA